MRRREAQGGGEKEAGTWSWRREGLMVGRSLALQSPGWGKNVVSVDIHSKRNGFKSSSNFYK